MSKIIAPVIVVCVSTVVDRLFWKKAFLEESSPQSARVNPLHLAFLEGRVIRERVCVVEAPQTKHNKKREAKPRVNSDLPLE